MDNIETLLKNAGIEIPAEKMESFKKDFSANYKTVAEFEKKDARITQLTESLNATQESLKAFENSNPDELKKQIATLQEQTKANEEKYQKELYSRDLNDAIERELAKEKFSSQYAKDAIRSKLMGSQISFKDGKLYGYTDVMNDIRENEKEAFVSAAEESKVKFSALGGQQGNSVSKDDYFKLKTSEERQAFIRQHAELFARK